MFRNFAIAAILVLAASSAQAEDSLSTRIHDAAVKACAAKIGDNLPICILPGVQRPLRGPCHHHDHGQHRRQAGGPQRHGRQLIL